LLDGIVANTAMLEAGGEWPGKSDHKVNIAGHDVDTHVLIFVILAMIIIVLILTNMHKFHTMLGFAGGDKNCGITNGFYTAGGSFAEVSGNFKYGGTPESHTSDNHSSDNNSEGGAMFVSI